MKFIFSLYILNKSAARRNTTKPTPEMMIHVKGLIVLLALSGMDSSFGFFIKLVFKIVIRNRSMLIKGLKTETETSQQIESGTLK